jgi:hypothetical protein
MSTNTRIITNHHTEQPGCVKTWRGQRYVTCQCLHCGQSFYAEEPREGITDEAVIGNEIIADAEELRAAEEELKRDIEEEDDDRRCV